MSVILQLFQLSRLQIIQLVCDFISPKLQLAGYLVGMIIPRYLGIVAKYPSIWQNIPLFCWCVFTSPKARTMRESLTKYLELISQGYVSSFGVESRADEEMPIDYSLECTVNLAAWGINRSTTRLKFVSLIPCIVTSCNL